MAKSPSLSFVKHAVPGSGKAVILVDETLALGPTAKALDDKAGGLVVK